MQPMIVQSITVHPNYIHTSIWVPEQDLLQNFPLTTHFWIIGKMQANEDSTVRKNLVLLDIKFKQLQIIPNSRRC